MWQAKPQSYSKNHSKKSIKAQSKNHKKKSHENHEWWRQTTVRKNHEIAQRELTEILGSSRTTNMKQNAAQNKQSETWTEMPQIHHWKHNKPDQAGYKRLYEIAASCH